MAKSDAAQTWTLNYRLVSRVITDMAPALAEIGLEAKELFMLDAIDDAPYPAELAQAQCMPKPTVTSYLKRLQAAGFVEREIDPEDLRRHRLKVTAAGRKVLERGLSLLADAFAERLDRLDTREQAQLQRLLEKLS